MAAGDGSSELGDDESKSPPQDAPTQDSPTTRTKRTEVPASAILTIESNHDQDSDNGGEEEEGDEADGESDDDDEEPRLKYATLTRNLSSLYKNGDMTSACLVAGDKMARKPETTARVAAIVAEESASSPQGSPKSKKSPRQPPVPRTASNDIYIATSSIDGHVCIQSLVDPDDVQLRNFGRPVQAVALSPDYKVDRSYLSGGQAGSLILTKGGQKGKSVNATTTGAAAAASGLLGSLGLGSNVGTDKSLHSGEGIITAIKWSPSGKYVLWVNEQGIKIMRSNLYLSDSNLEWKRISHINRPESEETMGTWKARVEWINRNNLELDEENGHEASGTNGSVSKTDQSEDKPDVEEVVVGWGDQIWLIRVSPSKTSSANDAAGLAEITANMKLGDCIISGVSLYTQNILLVLAYMEKKEKPKKANDGTRRSRMSRRNGLKPELRLIDIHSKEELESDMLSVGRFETLSSSDYHLAILPPIKSLGQAAQRGYLGSLGSGMTAVGSGLYTGVETVGQGAWDAAMYGPRRLGANRLFSSGDSIRSSRVGQEPTPSVKERNFLGGWIPGFGTSLFSKEDEQLTSVAVSQGMKIFIYSPFDTVVAIKRNISDKLQWLVESKRYQQAWELLDEHPEAAGPASEDPDPSSPPTPSKASSIARSGSAMGPPPTQVPTQNTLAEFFADATSITSSQPQPTSRYSSTEKEKRRIGELWLQQLLNNNQWTEAGEITEKVLSTTTQWDHWVWKFLSNQKFDDIAFHIPTFQITPPLASQVFEYILGHYVSKDRPRFKELLDQWPSDLFDISSITTVIKEQFKADNVRKGSDDWSILQECLAKLYLADGHYAEALKCYVSLQDADAAMSLIKEHHLIDAIADDIPDFVLLRIEPSQIKTAPREVLQELSSDPIKILVDEATHGIVEIDDVVLQLQAAHLDMFLFFYLCALWQGEGTRPQQQDSQAARGRATASNLLADEGKALVEAHADTAVELFAEYDRDMLMRFLHMSTSYTYETALKICEKYNYVEEQVYLLSKTGAMKKALFLIIDQLQDVSKAIAFAKAQDDRGLWNDFLDYSMSRPKFISGLLAEVGTAIDPIELVKRIPSGLEIEGLKMGLVKMLREYDIQASISIGAARVLSSEVAVGMGILREGRRQGIKFDIPKKSKKTKEHHEVAEAGESGEEVVHEISPGHCAACHEAFTPHETETLIGFACGHVYHISHLFHEPGEGENEHELPMPKLNKDADDPESGFTAGFTKTVGPKVTNARLLKDKVEAIGGCKICKARKDKIPDT